MTTTGNSPAGASQLDVVFDGTWVIVPAVDANGHITGVEVYSPACGHPQGVTFTNVLNPNPWPDSSGFYMLDPHGHTLDIQRGPGPQAGMNIGAINTAVNHCLAHARPIGSNWDLMVSISAGPDAWTSSGTIDPEVAGPAGTIVHCFSGQDAPTGSVSSTQRLSFRGVSGVQLCGAPANVQGLLPVPWDGNGSLIFEDEIQYIPTLQHERAAILAMANLAGLDLALDYPLPRKNAAGPSTSLRPMMHGGGYCGHAVIVFP